MSIDQFFVVLRARWLTVLTTVLLLVGLAAAVTLLGTLQALLAS